MPTIYPRTLLHEKAQLIKTIGTRMREARLLCDLKIKAAEKRLDYEGLAVIENATDLDTIPLWLIARAAKCYEVSVDYLYGAIDDWETGARMTQERKVSAWLFEAWEKIRFEDMKVVLKVGNKVEAIKQIMADMLSAAEGAEDALNRFIQHNPGFEDMKAGSALVLHINRITEATGIAHGKIKRFRLEAEMEPKNDNEGAKP